MYFHYKHLKEDYTRQTSLFIGGIFSCVGLSHLLEEQRVQNLIPYSVSGAGFLAVGLLLVLGSMFCSLKTRIYFQIMCATWTGILSLQYLVGYITGFNPSLSGFLVWACFTFMTVAKIDYMRAEMLKSSEAKQVEEFQAQLVEDHENE